MENVELHSILEDKLTECWAAYENRLLALPPGQIIGKAAEIAAARFCYDELAENGANYPEQYLEHLLAFNDPLEILREQPGMKESHIRDKTLDGGCQFVFQ